MNDRSVSDCQFSRVRVTRWITKSPATMLKYDSTDPVRRNIAPVSVAAAGPAMPLGTLLPAIRRIASAIPQKHSADARTSGPASAGQHVLLEEEGAAGRARIRSLAEEVIYFLAS